jgi:hypothetical protein
VVRDAGVPKEEQKVAGEIVAAHQLLLDALVLDGGASWLRPRDGPDMLGNGARILLIDIKRSELNVEHGSLDLRVPHELHQCRKAHARPYHVGSKRMAESV